LLQITYPILQSRNAAPLFRRVLKSICELLCDNVSGKKEKPQRLLCQVVTLKKELKVKRNHEGEWNWEDLENVVKILKQEKDKWKKREKRFHEVKWGDKQKSGYSGFNDNIDSRTSDALSELLRAEATFSAGLDDLRKLRQIINTVARSKLMMGQTTGLKVCSYPAQKMLCDTVMVISNVFCFHFRIYAVECLFSSCNLAHSLFGRAVI
jgi:hypothetical protein